MSQYEVYQALKRLGGVGTARQIRAQLPPDVAATCSVYNRLMKLVRSGLVGRVEDPHGPENEWKILEEWPWEV